MSDKFDREIGELLDARNRKQQVAEQQQRQREADAKRFTSEWTRVRNDVVIPTFESITKALAKRSVTAKIDSEGAVLSLQVVLQDHRARGINPPRISFEASPFTQSIKVDVADQSRNMKLIEITEELIEDAVLTMTRQYLRPEG